MSTSPPPVPTTCTPPSPALSRSRRALRAGRSASQLRARMEQDGKACVEALITASRLSGDTTPFWDRGLPEQSQSSFEDCPRLIRTCQTATG